MGRRVVKGFGGERDETVTGYGERSSLVVILIVPMCLFSALVG
jgi:hypothetical protein